MIDQFHGEYRWLSNFWPAEVLFDGARYPTVEHAYQASKTLNPMIREIVAEQPTPAMAKKSGNLFPLRSDWSEIKLLVMEDLLRQKFQVPELRSKLLATGEDELVEGNTWGDRFWGVCRGQGENHLGRLLMKIRDEVKLQTASV